MRVMLVIFVMLFASGCTTLFGPGEPACAADDYKCRLDEIERKQRQKESCEFVFGNDSILC